MRKTVIFTDAPGKHRALSSSLWMLGVEADIVVTYGPIYTYPRNLFPIGIGPNYSEVARQPASAKIVAQIQDCATRYQHYIVATSPDEAGDLIAADIASLLPGESLLRAPLEGLDLTSIKKALEGSFLITDKMGQAGLSRRVLDRILGAALLDPNRAVLVTLQQSTLLGLLSSKSIPFGECRLSVRCASGGPAFTCSIDMTRDNAAEIQEYQLRAHELELLELTVAGAEVSHEKPWDYIDCIVECAERLGASIKSVEAALQKLHDNGSLTFPHAGVSSLDAEAIARLESIASDHGVSFQPPAETVAQKGDLSSPRPLINVDVSQPVKLLDFESAVLTLITRQLIKAGRPRQIELADPAGLPEWAQGLKWTRTMHVGLPWKGLMSDRDEHAGVRKFRTDAALLRFASQQGLGSIPGIVDQVDRFIENGLADDEFILTTKGMRWLNATPYILRNLDVAIGVERVLKHHPGRSEDRVAYIVDHLDEDVARPIRESLNPKENKHD